VARHNLYKLIEIYSLHNINLFFNKEIAKGYSSNPQIARVLTENWVKQNSFCPCCGNVYLNDFENNRPVADFYCENCTVLANASGTTPRVMNLYPLDKYTCQKHCLTKNICIFAFFHLQQMRAAHAGRTHRH